MQQDQSYQEYKNLDEIVFEHRNKEYGAYPLRKQYNNNVFVGLIVTLSLVLFLILLPTLSRLLITDTIEEKPRPVRMVYTELSAPPPIDRPKPLSPAVHLPKLQKVIKFVPPKVVKEEVIETPPTIEELRQSDIAAVAQEGEVDVVFDEPIEEVVVEDDDEIFTVVEQQPEFEGGYEALKKYLIENMRYPAGARRLGVDGTVHVSFLVNKTGEISEIKVVRGILADCDAEALRVVGAMPNWKPGKQNGRPVHVRIIMPIKFSLRG